MHEGSLPAGLCCVNIPCNTKITYNPDISQDITFVKNDNVIRSKDIICPCNTCNIINVCKYAKEMKHLHKTLVKCKIPKAAQLSLRCNYKKTLNTRLKDGPKL